MSTAQIVGLALILCGLLDAVLGVVVVGPRIPDESRRRTVQVIFAAGGAILFAVGVAFLSGLINF